MALKLDRRHPGSAAESPIKSQSHPLNLYTNDETSRDLKKWYIFSLVKHTPCHALYERWALCSPGALGFDLDKNMVKLIFSELLLIGICNNISKVPKFPSGAFIFICDFVKCVFWAIVEKMKRLLFAHRSNSWWHILFKLSIDDLLIILYTIPV